MTIGLSEHDPELFNLIENERKRQIENIELIASENFTSQPVLECLGSVLTNKYSEGRTGRRYYGGNEEIDKIENLCETRALKAFNLDSNDWHVNVQPYSGSSANFSVYNAILKPSDKIMCLDLFSGGHLTHGFKTEIKKISASSTYFNSKSYHIDETGYIDYKELERIAINYKPKLIICGASAYPRDIKYDVFRKISDKVKAYLMADIAHISGFVSTGVMNDPFKYCDIVTSTPHKTLRGPRSGMIFAKKTDKLATKIDESGFPSLQGGPHNHQIAALATQFKEVMEPQFKNYILKVRENAKYLAKKLTDLGFQLSTDGTDNHILLIDLSNFGITGSKMEHICDAVNISLNKNTVYGDKSALSPSGIRIGTSCMTTRRMPKEGWDKLCLWLKKCVEISRSRQLIFGKKIKDFLRDIDKDREIIKLKQEIIDYSKRLYFPS